MITKPILIVICGESNTAAYVLNTDAYQSELAVNPNMQFLNNSTLIFEPWDVRNSALGHHMFETVVGLIHGWDLEISNLVRAGYFYGRKVYVIKTGQGGSMIEEWAVGQYYNTTMLTRINKALEQIPDDYDAYIMYSQGINNVVSVPVYGVAQISADEWKRQTLLHFQEIWGVLGQCPIVMTLFDAPLMTSPALAPYLAKLDINKAIIEICNETEGVSYIHTDGYTVRPDFEHWNYNETRSIANRMLQAFMSSGMSQIGNIILTPPLSCANMMRARLQPMKSPCTVTGALVASVNNVQVLQISDATVAVNGPSKSQLIATQYVQQIQADAAFDKIQLYVVVVTGLYTSAVNPAYIDQVNAWLAQNWNVGTVSGFVDLRTEPRLSDHTNPLFFMPNGIDLTPMGNDIVAGMIFMKINEIGNTISASNALSKLNKAVK